MIMPDHLLAEPIPSISLCRTLGVLKLRSTQWCAELYPESWVWDLEGPEASASSLVGRTMSCVPCGWVQVSGHLGPQGVLRKLDC